MKCYSCEKKIKLIYQMLSLCKCENNYCLNCIRSHDCKFDYIKHNQNILKERNCQVIAEKVIKI